MNSYYLSDLLEIKNGKDHKGLNDGEIPVFGSGGLMKYVDCALYENESILLPRKGTLSNIQYVKKPFWTVDTLYYTIINKEKAVPYYLYYFLKQLDLSKLNSGTGVPSMTFGAYYGVRIQLPSLSVQQKVASVLSSLDKKIELNNKINAELEAMAKTLYDYWFVQFDFPNEDGKPYKSSGGKMVYSEVLKREIPEGWEVKRLDEIESNIVTGKTPSTVIAENFGGDIPFITIDDIRKQLFIYKSDRTLSELGADSQSSKYLEVGDICVSCIGTVGVIGLVGRKAQTNQQINSVSKIKNFNRFFLLNALKNYFADNNVAKQGAVLANMNKAEFSNIPVLDSTIELKQRYNNIVSCMYSNIDNNLKQSQELAELRDWLLPMLMNGQVSVGSVVVESKQEMRKDEGVKDLFGDEEYLKRKMLAVYICNQSLNDQSFGKTKFMKLMHLIEYHIVKDNDITREYYKHTAGPYDGAFANKFWDEVIEDKWYRFEELGKLQHVVCGAKHKDTEDYENSIADDLKQQISEFINLFKVTTYKQPEIVSTLYAVWNNRMIQKEMITDALLKQDFLAWDEQKIKYSDVLDKALGWMRANKIVPTGFGSVIKASKSRRGI